MIRSPGPEPRNLSSMWVRYSRDLTRALSVEYLPCLSTWHPAWNGIAGASRILLAPIAACIA